ncbi:MAG: DUF2231 domain-containing protein [Ornithinibacter sp.]
MPTATTRAVTAVQRLEQNPSLDRLRSFYGAIATPLDRWSGSDLLRSGVIGHALHPFLTDLPLGFWTAATALDLRGRPEDHAASRWLVGAGLAASGPTALTGLAEWAPLGREPQRVGALHGVLNGAAVTLYLASYVARSRRRHSLGVATALAGAALTGVSGYLGGHLTTARKVGSRNQAFARDAVGPPDADPGTDRPMPPIEPVVGPGALT